MPPRRAAIGVPKDTALLEDLRAEFRQLTADAVAEVWNFLDEIGLHDAEAADCVATLNHRVIVIVHEVSGVAVVIASNEDDNSLTLVAVSTVVPQRRTALYRCARALGLDVDHEHYSASP